MADKKHVLVVNIPENTDNKDHCANSCPFRRTQAISPHNSCLLYGPLVCSYDTDVSGSARVSWTGTTIYSTGLAPVAETYGNPPVVNNYGIPVCSTCRTNLHSYTVFRHAKCLACPTLDLDLPANKNSKEIKEEILVFADRLEDLGALSLAKTFRSLLKDITVEEK